MIFALLISVIIFTFASIWQGHCSYVTLFLLAISGSATVLFLDIDTSLRLTF